MKTINVICYMILDLKKSVNSKEEMKISICEIIN